MTGVLPILKEKKKKEYPNLKKKNKHWICLFCIRDTEWEKCQLLERSLWPGFTRKENNRSRKSDSKVGASRIFTNSPAKSLQCLMHQGTKSHFLTQRQQTKGVHFQQRVENQIRKPKKCYFWPIGLNPLLSLYILHAQLPLTHYVYLKLNTSK